VKASSSWKPRKNQTPSDQNIEMIAGLKRVALHERSRADRISDAITTFGSSGQRQADRRAHLDLQVTLLAEQEMTMVLRMLRRICEKIDVEPEPDNPEFRHLFEDTDVHQLITELQRKLPEQAR
jgi:uncharacterized membrane protein